MVRNINFPSLLQKIFSECYHLFLKYSVEHYELAKPSANGLAKLGTELSLIVLP